MTSSAVVTTERLELWRPQPGDLAGLHAMMDDAETARFAGNTLPSLADSFARQLRNAGSWALYGYGAFMVREPGHEKIIGNCGIFRSFRGFGVEMGFDDAAEAGWIIHRDHWRRGYAREAMVAALAWFDQEHGPQRVVCMIEEGNTVSQALAAKLGFTERGRHQPEDGPALVLYERC